MIHLPLRVLSSNDLGRIDQVIAKSIKSRVLVYAASPLFNGNSEMYSGFVNENGEHYFNQSYESYKWELARDASLDAINAALENGVGLYEFTSTPPNYEDEYDEEPFVQKLYDLKYSIVDKWNSCSTCHAVDGVMEVNTLELPIIAWWWKHEILIS